jgi:hypothetical protein
MKTSVLLAFVCAMVMALFAVPANAQATRTWVSGVGDDANPCSRTAPCKTFAGAISKTATAGEINCLDPGGFGALTITKSIAIICPDGEEGVLVSGTNGITVAGSGPLQVFLQGIDFEGLGGPGSISTPGITGISFTATSGSLYVKDCTIRGFATTGITFAPSGAGTSVLTVDNTVVTDQVIASPKGGGILIAPTGGAVAQAQITNTRSIHNLFGLKVQDNAKVTMSNSVISNNTNGIVVVSASVAAEANVNNTAIANNSNSGVATSGANATIRIAYDSIFDNGTGINTSDGGTVTSFSPATNANAGNGTPGAPNGSTIGLQ